MAGKTHWFETQLLNHVFRTTSYTQPGTLYIGLYTATPNDDHTSGSPTGTEVTIGSNNYQRATIGTLDANWTLTAGSGATAGKVDNTAVITFNVPSGTWGNVTHFAILDASSAGNMLYYAALTTPKTINSGDTVTFAANALAVNED